MSEYDEFDKTVANHWAIPLLETPHALVSVIETKIARAVLAERRRIINLIRKKTYDSKTGNDLCWIADISNVTQSELIELIDGGDN